MAKPTDPRKKACRGFFSEAMNQGDPPAPAPSQPSVRLRGSVGFAMGPDKKVRSQFFIMTAPKPRLADGGYPCFATVIGGMDGVDRLEACDVLQAVRILKKRDHPYAPKKSY